MAAAAAAAAGLVEDVKPLLLLLPGKPEGKPVNANNEGERKGFNPAAAAAAAAAADEDDDP